MNESSKKNDEINLQQIPNDTITNCNNEIKNTMKLSETYEKINFIHNNEIIELKENENISNDYFTSNIHMNSKSHTSNPSRPISIHSNSSIPRSLSSLRRSSSPNKYLNTNLINQFENSLQSLDTNINIDNDLNELDAVEIDNANSLYTTRKTIANGMMDIALITANANQLRILLEFGQPSTTYYIIMILIIISLCIQTAVGISLIFKHQTPYAASTSISVIVIDNLILSGIFLVTVINAFIAAFTSSMNYNKT